MRAIICKAERFVFIEMLGGGITRSPHRTCLALVAVRQYRFCFAWFYSRQPGLAATVVTVSENHSTEIARSPEVLWAVIVRRVLS
jgi:hypothetical protein